MESTPAKGGNRHNSTWPSMLRSFLYFVLSMLICYYFCVCCCCCYCCLSVACCHNWFVVWQFYWFDAVCWMSKICTFNAQLKHFEMRASVQISRWAPKKIRIVLTPKEKTLSKFELCVINQKYKNKKLELKFHSRGRTTTTHCMGNRQGKRERYWERERERNGAQSQADK